MNFKKSQVKREPLMLFAKWVLILVTFSSLEADKLQMLIFSRNEVEVYTKKYSRYIKLTKAKQDLLYPLL